MLIKKDFNSTWKQLKVPSEWQKGGFKKSREWWVGNTYNSTKTREYKVIMAVIKIKIAKLPLILFSWLNIHRSECSVPLLIFELNATWRCPDYWTLTVPDVNVSLQYFASKKVLQSRRRKKNPNKTTECLFNCARAFHKHTTYFGNSSSEHCAAAVYVRKFWQ